MQAIILAAGMGKRLRELTRYKTKCMIEVAGEAIIDRMLNNLLTLNLNKIVIVTGHGHNNLKTHILSNYENYTIEFIHNDHYETTNNIYSLSLIKEYLKNDDTIILESDIVFDSNILSDLLKNSSPNVAVIAKFDHWMDGTMVQIDDNQNIIKLINKCEFDINKSHTYYKTVNIYKFSKEFSKKKYLPFLEAYIASFGRNQYYEQVLNIVALVEKTELQCMVLDGQIWYEIDDQLDLENANVLFAKDTRLSRTMECYGGYWRFKKLLDFCYLVNPYFPTKKLKDQLKYMFDELIVSYPSGLKVNNFLASHLFDINPEYVCVGNGASELIKIVADLLKGRTGIIYPTFEEYHRCFEQYGIVPYYVKKMDFRYTVDDLMSFFDDKEVDTILLVNPDNPSGNYIDKNDIRVFIEWTTERGINLIIDESFIDFAGLNNSSLKDDILRDNLKLIVVRSISKSYGIPGLRLGILASSNEHLIHRIRQELPIWNINSCSEYFLQNIKCHIDDYVASCSLVMKERNRFFSLLNLIKYLQVFPSSANFFLCRVLHPYTSEGLTKKLLDDHNILIKNCSNKIGMLGTDLVRIAIKSKEENDSILLALNHILLKEEYDGLAEQFD